MTDIKSIIEIAGAGALAIGFLFAIYIRIGTAFRRK